MLFRRKEINPFSVSDKVVFRNVDRTETLTVRGDASAIVSGLRRVNATLSGMTEETPEEERVKAAHDFAAVMFGPEQADVLLKLYDNNPLSVITACGMYFQSRLSGIITKAQKHKK